MDFWPKNGPITPSNTPQKGGDVFFLPKRRPLAKSVVLCQFLDSKFRKNGFSTKNRFFDPKTHEKWVVGIENRYFCLTKAYLAQKSWFLSNLGLKNIKKIDFRPKNRFFEFFALETCAHCPKWPRNRFYGPYGPPRGCWTTCALEDHTF